VWHFHVPQVWCAFPVSISLNRYPIPLRRDGAFFVSRSVFSSNFKKVMQNRVLFELSGQLVSVHKEQIRNVLSSAKRDEVYTNVLDYEPDRVRIILGVSLRTRHSDFEKCCEELRTLSFVRRELKSPTQRKSLTNASSAFNDVIPNSPPVGNSTGGLCKPDFVR